MVKRIACPKCGATLKLEMMLITSFKCEKIYRCPKCNTIFSLKIEEQQTEKITLKEI